MSITFMQLPPFSYRNFAVWSRCFQYINSKRQLDRSWRDRSCTKPIGIVDSEPLYATHSRLFTEGV
jgi:hypothetical protein